jgi:hypothetical protein
VCVCMCVFVFVCVLNDSHNTQRWKNIALCVRNDLNMLVCNAKYFNL